MQQTNQEYRSSYNEKEFITKVTARLQEYKTQYEQSLQRKKKRMRRRKDTNLANTDESTNLDDPILNPNNKSSDESSDESSDKSDWANEYDVNSDDENQVSAMTRSRLTEKAIADANDEDERIENVQMKAAEKAAFKINYFPIKASKTENKTKSNGTTYISFVTKTTFVIEKATGLVFEISKADPELETETMAYEEGKSFKDLEFTSSWADVDEADASLFNIILPNIRVNIGLKNDEDKYLPEYFDFFARFKLIDYYSTEESDYTRERKETRDNFRLPNFTLENIELMEQNWVQYARDVTIVRRLEDAYENLSSMRAKVDMYPDKRKGLGIVLELWEEEEYDTLDEEEILEKLENLDPDLQDTSYSNFLDTDPIRGSFSSKNIITYIEEGEKGIYEKQSKEKELNKSNIKVKLKKTGDGGYEFVKVKGVASPKKPKPATINPPAPRVTIKYIFTKFQMKYAKFNSSSDYYYRFDTDIKIKDYMNVMLADPDPDGFAKLEPELQTLYVTAAMMRSRFKEYLFVNSEVSGYDYYNVPDFIEAFILKEATKAFTQLKSNPNLARKDKDVLINTIGCYGGWLYAKSKLQFNTELKNFVLENAEDIISKFEEKIYKEERKNGHPKKPILPALKPTEVLKLTHGAQYVSWWNKEIKPSSNPKKHYERYKSIILEKCLVSIDRFKTSIEKITKRKENASISGVMIQDLDLILELFLCVPCILKRAYKSNHSSGTLVLNIDKLLNTIIYHCFSVKNVAIQRQVLHLLLISIYIQNIVKEPSCEGLDSFGKENTSKIETVRYERGDTNLNAEIEEKLLSKPAGNIKVNLVEFGKALSSSSENQQEFLLDDDIEKYKDKASKNANDYYYYQLLLLRKKMLETTFHNQYEIIPNTTYFRVKQPLNTKGRSTQHTQLHSDYFNVVFNKNTRKINDLTVAQDCRTIWVPLTDISISSSYLKIAKHCMPLDSKLGYFDTDEFTGIPIPEYVDENTEDLAYKIGDYVAFGLNVPHEGTPHKSQDKIRVSFDFRIQPRKQLNNPDAAAERLLNDFRIILEYLQTKYSRSYGFKNDPEDIKKQKQWAFARDIEFFDDFKPQFKDLILQTKTSTIPKFKSLFYTYKMATELLVQHSQEEEKLAYNKLSTTADFKKKYSGITKKQISELNEILTVVSRWYPKKEGTSFFKMFWKILPRSDSYAWRSSDAAKKRDAKERWEDIRKYFEKEPSGNDLYVILRDLEKCILTEKMLKKGNKGKRRMVLAPFVSFQYPYEEVSFLNADLEKEVIDYYFFQSRSATHEPPDSGLDFYKYARLTVSGAYDTAKYGQSLKNLDTNWFIAYKQLCHIWFNVNTKLFKALKNLKDNFLVYFNALCKYFDYSLIDENTLNEYDESSEDETPTEIEGAVDLDAPPSDEDDNENPPKGKEETNSNDDKKTPKEVSI